MMRKFPLFEAACLAAMVAAPVALGLVLSTGSSAMAAEKEKKPAVAVACTAPCIDGNEIEAGAVGAADIATGAVGADAIGTGAVGADEISDGAIGVGKLGFDPATQDELESHVTLGNLTCGEGQAVKMVSGEWTCADDDSVDYNTLMNAIDSLAHLYAGGYGGYVFVTSGTYTGDLVSEAMSIDASFTGTGVEAADFICQRHAEDGGMPGFYKAWIAGSADDSGPRDRFYKVKSDYILPPGESSAALEKVGDSYEDVVKCQIFSPWNCLDHAINVDEFGFDVSAPYDVWSNVSYVLPYPFSTYHCSNWSDNASSVDGHGGWASDRDRDWTTNGELPCDSLGRLYCFGQ
jgi:hypothetical protein